MPGGSNLRGALMALLGFGIYATHDVVVKYLGGTYSAFQIVFFSTLLSFPVVTVMLMRDRTDGNLRPKLPRLAAIRTLNTVVTAFGAFYAFSHLPLAQVYAILFATPLLITVLAIPILGETVRLRRWAAVIVGLVGVLIVVRPGAATLTLGHLAALAAAVGGAIAAILLRKIGGRERPAVMLLYPMLGNFVVMGCAMPFAYRPLPIGDLGALAVIAVFSSLAALCLIAAYRAGEAGIVAPMQYSQIVWASVYGALFFGERPSLSAAIGIAIIIASGVYIVVREGRMRVSVTQPVRHARSRAVTSVAPRFDAVSGR